jgi:mono/diheme cytochrome c family protein
MRTSRGGVCLATCVLSVGVASAFAGCGGGNGNSKAPQFTERDYAPIARAQAPAAAYLQWKAKTDGRPSDEILSADEAMAAGRNPYSTEDADAVRSGRVIYIAHCAGCHGDNADGRGPVMAGQYLKAMDFHAGGKSHSIFFGGGGTPRKWFDRVHDGVASKSPKVDGSPNQMPPFRDTLTNEQIWLSLTYLHGVVAGEPAAIR